MEILLIFLLVFLFSIFMFNYTSKKQKRIDKEQGKQSPLSTKTKNIGAFQLYLNWCHKHKLTPVSEDDFNSLAIEGGNIDISDMLALHPEFDIKTRSEDYENVIIKEEVKREKRDREFVNSTIIGYMTKSTTKGTLFGGNLFGGMLGSHLSKKKRK